MPSMGINTLDNGQSDPGAFVFRAKVPALEGAEQLADVTLIKPNAIVLDVVNFLITLDPPAHFDDCNIPGTWCT